jgi:hypothetical protein
MAIQNRPVIVDSLFLLTIGVSSIVPGRNVFACDDGWVPFRVFGRRAIR